MEISRPADAVRNDVCNERARLCSRALVSGVEMRAAPLGEHDAKDYTTCASLQKVKIEKELMARLTVN